MIELRLELTPYDPEKRTGGVRKVQRSAQTSGNSGYSAYSDDGDVTLSRPALPRKRAALAEDTYEFGVVRYPEIEL